MLGSVYSEDAYNDSISLGFKVITMADFRRLSMETVIENIRNRVARTEVFVTFDIDVVDPAFAPGTGTPEVEGFTSGEAIDLVHGLKGLYFVGFDLVEVLPAYDTADITALLAANLIYEFLSLIALNKKIDRL